MRNFSKHFVQVNNSNTYYSPLKELHALSLSIYIYKPLLLLIYFIIIMSGLKLVLLEYIHLRTL